MSSAALLAALLALVPAQENGAPALPPEGWPGAEGPLHNASSFGASDAASEALEDGDRRLERARRAGDPTGLGAAFDAWVAALEATRTGDRVERPEDRFAPGVEEAVWLRLEALEPAEREAWTARAEARAAAPLAPRDAARVERVLPGTSAALAAALRLGDAAFEAGRLGAARASWARAERHRAFLPAGPATDGVAAALARRLEALGAAGGGPSEPEPWRGADELESEVDLVLDEGRAARGRSSRSPLGAGLASGACVLGDGRLAVHEDELVWVLGGSPAREEFTFAPGNVIQGSSSLPAPPPVWGAPRPPGWALAPRALGDAVLLVVGRATEERSNALAAIRPPPTRTPGSSTLGTGLALPELLWAVSPPLWSPPGGDARPHELLDFEGGAELQPGTVTTDGLVLAQVRQRDAEVRAWLVAFDARTGEPRWRTFLARGTELLPDPGRFGRRPREALAAEPLVATAGRVFAGTHLGAGVLLDAADGRFLWGVRSQRRGILEAGWPGRGPVAAPAAAGRPAAVLWAPHDAGHLYWLPADASALRAGWLHAPRPIGEAEALVGGDAHEALVVGRAGARRTLSAWDGADGGRVDSFHLAPGEEVTTAAVASARRVLFASDRALYLVDRERDLYLLDAEPLDRRSAAPHALVPWDGRLALLGPGTVRVLRAR